MTTPGGAGGRTNWLVRQPRTEPREAPALRLVCLAHAGGGPGAFRSWAAMVPPDVEVLAARLPGRESAYSEPLCVEMGQVLDRLAPEVAGLGDVPFVVFGHSMGAVVGFALCLRLQDLGAASPLLLVVSGHEAPHADWPRSYHRLGDQELARLVASFSGTPEGVLSNPDLVNFFLPAVRADLMVLETYLPPLGDRVSSPVFAYVGESDRLDAAGVAKWAELTTGGFSYRSFPGGHFYLAGQAQAVVASVIADAGAVLAGTA